MNECFPNKWKKANITPVHKKCEKQIIKSYRLASVLPICSKTLEESLSLILSLNI